MSSSSGRVGADAFASIRPSTNPTFGERTSTTGAASSDPPMPQAPPLPSTATSSSSYTMRVVQQETTTTSPPSFAKNNTTATLPARGGGATTLDFSGRRDDVFFPSNTAGSTASSTSTPPGGFPYPFRVGDGDLRPTPQGMGGIGGMGGGGGNYVGSNHPAFQPRNGGVAPNQPTHPNGARYLPMFTGDPGVGPQPPGGGGSGPNGLFSGEPDPDHLPPFDLSRLQQPPNQLPRQFGGGPPSNNNFYC